VSDPTDQQPTDPMDDRDLSALYTRGSTEQPSPELDQAILEEAKESTRQQNARTQVPFQWSNAVSIAAVMVVSVTLVILIQKEAPEPESIALQSTIAKEEIPKPAPTDSPVMSLAKRLPEKKDAPVPTDITDNGFSDKSALIKEAKKQKEKAASKAPAREILSRNSMLKQAAPQDKQSPKPQISLQMGISAGMMSREDEVQEDISCQQLSEAACFTSAACTLTRNRTNDGYQCRPAKDHCELLFRQSDGTKENCESRTGCEFIPATCYCPPGITCVCGGGEPAQCRSKK